MITDDKSGLLAKLADEIKIAAKHGDAFIIDRDMLPRYERLGGKKEDLSKTLKIAYLRAYESDLELAKSSAKSCDLMCLKLVTVYLMQYAVKIGKNFSEIEQVVNSMPEKQLARYKGMRV